MEKELVKRVRNGDDSAFAELVHPLIEKGYRASYSILRSKEKAEEVLQISMIEAYRNIMNGKEIHYFTTWFLTLVSHRSIDMIRKFAKEKEFSDEISLIAEKENVEEAIIKDETEGELKKSITSLTNEDYRTVLLLYYYQELSINEIANLLNLKIPTVKSHLRRGRNALEKKLLENQMIEVNIR
ncbi:sigma-70 family RNA polymerase sigma factor [Metabacillus litoralis]|uniref:Sigma-70 family RNA polymerase sigma factor n=1 Tax=Metabacillus litoralis TaxID=152268 RepID=A0A5C6W189_9BACI|nr:sigma-70 family RNA polymerase sigma factor [Metabacillus litoralis]TXC91035.1 sigma-70 family RNA polymerase sigma factor [Metabacillus litoralis]